MARWKKDIFCLPSFKFLGLRITSRASNSHIPSSRFVTASSLFLLASSLDLGVLLCSIFSKVFSKQFFSCYNDFKLDLYALKSWSVFLTTWRISWWLCGKSTFMISSCSMPAATVFESPHRRLFWELWSCRQFLPSLDVWAVHRP